MPYYGKQIMQREGVDLIAPHWPNQKVKGCATMGAESNFFVGAVHIYVDSEDEDVGLLQHALKASEKAVMKPKLWTDSKDPAIWLPIAKENVRLAYEKWNSPMRRPAGQPQKRLWQPWVAYTSGWAMYPEAWAWHHIIGEDGKPKPTGPWVPSGRRLHQAIRAVANWHLLIASDLGIGEAVDEAIRLADQFGITKGDILYDVRHAVYWKYPPAPTEPPSAEPWGYPVRNDGR